MRKVRSPRSARGSISNRLRSRDNSSRKINLVNGPAKVVPELGRNPRSSMKRLKLPSSPRVPAVRKGVLKGRRRTVSGVFAPSEAKADGKSSPIKTRLLLQKSKAINLSRCTLCKSSKGDLHACIQCHKLYHLRQCILYSAEMAANAVKTSWLCPKCVLCAKCNLMIDDPLNVECCLCLRAWHGACKPSNGRFINRLWHCRHCLNSPRTSVSYRSSSKITLTVESSSADTVGFLHSISPKKGRKRKSETDMSDNAINAAVLSNIAANVSKDERIASLLKARDDLQNGLIIADDHKKKSSRSPRKRTFSDSSIAQFLEEDAELFKQALDAEESFLSVKEESDKQLKEQWVNLGGEMDMKVLYSSPYPDNIKSVPIFFVCSFCLKPSSEWCSFIVHQEHCPRITPPGREIYRDATSSHSFFEVDGAEERTYCRNLCLFAMQFLAWKTRHSEIATFLFYVLTRNDEDGCRIVGYFSKEKNPSRNYNLSCLLTVPSEQRNGYGQLLIDMSYQLSRLERKVGGPERPLSDRGLLTYRKYWRSSILCYLRAAKDCHSISLKNMSLATRIHPTDIVHQLLHDNILVMKDENYFFRTWKRAYKLPLSMLRRRVIDPTKINWTPKFDVTVLDPFKLNCYV